MYALNDSGFVFVALPKLELKLCFDQSSIDPVVVEPTQGLAGWQFQHVSEVFLGAWQHVRRAPPDFVEIAGCFSGHLDVD